MEETEDGPLSVIEYDASSEGDEYFNSDMGDMYDCTLEDYDSEFDDDEDTDENEEVDGKPLLLPKLEIGNESSNASPNWTDVPTPMKEFPFTKTNELLHPIPGNNEPFDYFHMIFDDEILNLMVNETNHYAEQMCRAERALEKSKFTQWKPVTYNEMLTFFGLIMQTGTIKMERLEDYWKTDPLFNLDIFMQHMSCDRFLLIMRCLRFSRNPLDGEKSQDKFHKIRPILNIFNNKMSNIYYPGKVLCLDDAMVLSRKRMIFRENLRKGYRYDLKLYMLTEPDGMVLKSFIYNRDLDDCVTKRPSSKIALDLLENYYNSGHSVYLGYCYNSFQLAHELTNRSTYCTGYLSLKSKDNPKDLVATKLKKGETVARYSNNIMIGRWKNRPKVLYISNEHGNDLITYAERRNHIRETPAALFHNDQYMDDEDRQDQMMSYYPCEMIALPWHKKLGIHFIHLMLLNSYLLYKKYSGRKMSLHKFRFAVLEKLLHFEERN